MAATHRQASPETSSTGGRQVHGTARRTQGRRSPAGRRVRGAGGRTRGRRSPAGPAVARRSYTPHKTSSADGRQLHGGPYLAADCRHQRAGGCGAQAGVAWPRPRTTQRASGKRTATGDDLCQPAGAGRPPASPATGAPATGAPTARLRLRTNEPGERPPTQGSPPPDPRSPHSRRGPGWARRDRC